MKIFDLFKKESPPTPGLYPSKLLPAPGRYRDLEPRSIHDRRELLNELFRLTHIELRVALYAYGEDCYLISATTSIAEAGAPIKLPVTVSDSELGYAIFDLLLQSYAHPVTGDGLLENWAVFVASGEKTGKSFQKKSTYVSVNTANSAIIVEASWGFPPSNIYVGEQLSIGCDADKLGSVVKQLVRTLRFLDSQNAL